MKFLTIILTLMISTQISFAQTQYNHHTLTIFKNGLVYIEKSTHVEVKNKQATLYPLPFSTEEHDIVLGSIQLKPEQNKLESLKYERQIVDENHENYHENLLALFQANLGTQLSVSSKEKNVKGKLKSIIIDNLSTPKLLIASGTQMHFIPVSDVTSVDFIEQPKAAVDSEKIGEWVYALQLAKNQKKQKIAISYLQKGMQWLPNYYLDIETDNTAILSMEATLINDIETFENADVNLAVGLPYFQFKDFESPLTNAHKENVGNLAQHFSINQNRREQYASQTVNLSEADVSFSPEAAESSKQEDLYFFRKKSISLKKNGRLAIPLFEKKIQYDELYKVTLQQNLDNYGNWIKNEAQKNTVSQHIEFNNNNDFPLTTGSFYIRKNKEQLRFLGQGKLDYTAVNEIAKPKISLSADIRVKEESKEISRKEIRKPNEHSYYLITMTGEIEITNFKSKNITIEVDKAIIGTLKKSSSEWKHTSAVSINNNPKNHVTWKLEVPAGKTVTIEYEYTYSTK